MTEAEMMKAFSEANAGYGFLCGVHHNTQDLEPRPRTWEALDKIERGLNLLEELLQKEMTATIE